MIDLIAGYNYELGSCFALRPFGGLRGARIDQKLRITEFDDSFSSSDFSSSDFSPLSFSSSSALFTRDVHNKEKFSGLGPLIGIEAAWNVGCGFSVYASISAACLYGKFNIRVFETDLDVNAANFCQVRYHTDASLAVADAALGVRWQTCFCDNMRLILQLGLEHHRYFDYNRIGCYGDLSFDGLNLSAGIEF